MSFPFSRKRRNKGAIDPEGCPQIGFTLDSGEPIFAPPGSTITYAPTGAGKTTLVAMPSALSFVASNPQEACLISDPKDAEICGQLLPVLVQMGRKVALIDDFGCLPEFEEHRIELNPFGAATAAYNRDPRDLIYANEMNAQALIEEPKDQQDMRNFYFRESPRQMIRFANSVFLDRNPDVATPGGAASLLSDTDMLLAMAKVAEEEGNPSLQAEARAVLQMCDHEHFLQHLNEALRALRHFGPGTRLEDAGNGATLSHEDLIHGGYVIFMCGPQAIMQYLGPLYALHFGAFTQALYQNIGTLRIIADEFTNSPLRSIIGPAITTVRSYGGSFHLIAQSRSEVLRLYGEHLTQTIEDNCVCKRWLAFGSYQEAETISKAVGEEHAVASGLSGDVNGQKLQTSLSLTKQRLISASELMALDRDQQLVHIRGIGYFICRTVAQNEIAPYCDMLADNKLEGGRLPSDPKITFTFPEISS